MPVSARRKLKGAASRLPAEYHAQLAQLVGAPTTGDEWLHEVKFDGYRIGAFVEHGDVRLVSRNHNDWSARFPTICAALAKLPIATALLDGEVAAVLQDGRTSFQTLQNTFSGESRYPLTYFIFDVLHLDGEDLTVLPLEGRKRRVQQLLSKYHGVDLRYSDHVIGQGEEFFADACKHNLEGILSKRRAAPYRAGRSLDWVKVKCIRRQEFVIGGFTEPQGSRSGLGALLIGVQEAGKGLVFAGKVGTGFSNRSAHELRLQLDRIERKAPPFIDPPLGAVARRAHWVKPSLVAEVAFTEWTSDGKVRHPSFQGLRRDKSANQVKREEPVATPRKTKEMTNVSQSKSKSSLPSSVAGVPLSHPERLLWPEPQVTKLDLARYYEEIAPWILPHVQGRPLTLVRCPKGIGTTCFYMKHSPGWPAPGMERVRIAEKQKVGEYLVIDSVEALVGLAQMDVLEVHTWNSTRDHLEEPNRVIFDLDPGPAVEWPAVVQTAKLLRELLTSLNLGSFVKTTGGKGLHVVVPLQPSAGWDLCLEFTAAVSDAVVSLAPQRYTTRMPKKGREAKILIDYFRNSRGSTSVAAFSTRAREGAPVSVPLDWSELTARIRSDRFTVTNLRKRLKSLEQDPWREYWKCRQRLTAGLVKNVRTALKEHSL